MRVNPYSLFVADPLEVLRRLDPHQFDLVFLDPPYFGGQLVDLTNPQELPYHNFNEYLQYIVNIFRQSHRVLNQNGAVLLLINPLSPINGRLFLDRIFGKQNFRTEIIWHNKPISHHTKSEPYANFESVYFYSKTDNFTYFEPFKMLSEKEIKQRYSHYDKKGFYRLVSLWDRIDRFDKNFIWNGTKPPKGFTWKYSEKRLNELDAFGEIARSGESLKRKVYFSEKNNQIPLGFVWDDLGDLNSEKFRTDPRLNKLIELASKPNDVIFDPFLSPISHGTYIRMDRGLVGVSPFEISPKEFSEFRSNHFEVYDRNTVHSLNIVEDDGIPLNLQRLIDAEARAVDPHIGIKKNSQKYAFLVGINHYKDRIGDLRYCINDVIQLGKTLENLGYQIKIIHDEMEDDNLIPLRSNIETELYSWTQSLTSDDTLFVHFSGHGTLIDNDARIITSDTRIQRIQNTTLRLLDIINIMKSGRARKLVLSVDVCHGGVEMGRAMFDVEFIQNVYENAEGFVLLAASTAQQQAFELSEYQHGLFTYYLIQGLCGGADFDEDGRITVEDIRNYTLNSIRDWNARNGRRQEPTYKSEGIGEITLVEP